MSLLVRFLRPRSWLAALLIVVPITFSAVLADDADAKPDAALSALRERVKAAATDADRTRLRQDLLAFEVARPGPLAAKAAALLSQLPSPLDALNANTIPPLERFDWQPKELVAVLGEHRGRHGVSVASTLFSPDGSLIASGGGSLVRLWDPETMRLIGLAGFGSGVTSMAFNKDGSTLAVGGTTGLLALYDIAKGKAPVLRWTVLAGSSQVYGIAFHPDGKVLAAACHDNNVRLYDATGPKARDLVAVNTHTGPVTAIAYSPDGKFLVSGSQDETIRLWSVQGENITERTALDAGAKGVNAMTFSPSSTTLAAATNDGHIRLWTIPTAKAPPKLILPLKAGAFYSLCYSNTGNTLAIACSDSTIRLWSVAGGLPRERFKLDGHKGAVTSLMYSPDNKRLVSGSADWTVRTWDLTTTRPKERFEPWSHLSSIDAVAYAPDSQSLVSGGVDTHVRVWDLARAQPRTRSFLKGDDAVIQTVAYSPDGKSVAAGGMTTRVRQWDASTGREKPQLSPTPTVVYKVAYSPDGKKLLTQCRKDVILWDAARGRQLQGLGLGNNAVNGAAWSPDGKQVLTWHGDNKYLAGKLVRRKDGSPDYTDCVLRLHDAQDGHEIAITPEGDYPIGCGAFAVDGRTAYSSGSPTEALLRRWEVGPTALVAIAPWTGLESYVTAMLSAPDGETAILRLGSGMLAQHEVATGKRLRSWTFHENISGIAYSSDGRYMAVGLATGVGYILRLTPPPEGGK
jgi:WD40 repeat protein